MTQSTRRVGLPFGSPTRSPILRIAGRAFLVSIAVMLVSFSLMRLSPGDPVTVLLGENATDEAIANMREQLGLNGTFLEQLAQLRRRPGAWRPRQVRSSSRRP